MGKNAPSGQFLHQTNLLSLFPIFRPENIKYDVKYALRLCCEKHDMHREAVYLFCVLGHLEEAVTVALEHLTLDDAKVSTIFFLRFSIGEQQPKDPSDLNIKSAF